MKKDSSVSTGELSRVIGISIRKIKRNIAKLKLMGFVTRVGPPKGGCWKVSEPGGTPSGQDEDDTDNDNR